jgi:hypothetical protein
LANLTDIAIAELLRPQQPHGWSDTFFAALALGAVFAVTASIPS